MHLGDANCSTSLNISPDTISELGAGLWVIPKYLSLKVK
jgi:hypothetical protein